MAQHSLYPRRLNGFGIAAILSLCMALGACSVSSTQSVLQPTATGGAKAPIATVLPTATASATSVPPQAHVVGVSSSIVSVGSDTSGAASASCSSGDPMLGGGFIVSLPNNNDGIPPTDSYPSAASTWTVTVSTLADTVQLRAIVVCLQANFPVTMQVAQASNSGPDTTVNCPNGSVLTGGGFRSGGGVNYASAPSGNGWKVSTASPFGGSATPTSYAVCATSGLKAATTQSQSKNATNGAVVSNGASCSSGQLPVGGGYNGYPPSSDQFWHVFLNSPDTGQGTVSSGWMAEVDSGQLSTSAFTVYSVCATH